MTFRLPARPVVLIPSAVIALLFAYAFVRGGLFPAHLSRSYHGLLWMVAILGAFLGTGAFVLRRAGAPRASIALAGAIGMATWIAIGGLALLLGIAARPYLVASVGIGLAFGIEPLLEFRLRRRSLVSVLGRARRSPISAGALVVVLGFLLSDAVVRTTAEILHPRDDLIAYVPLAEDIVESGRSVQPFSFRRTCVLGGQELLDATFLAPHADPRLLRAIESGVGALLLALFAWVGVRRQRGTARLLPLLAVATIPILPIYNLASDSTSAVLLLAAMLLVHERRLSPRVRWLLGAGLLATLVTLRNTNLVPALVVLAIDRATADEDGETRFRGTFASVSAFVAILLPWLYGSYRSNDSWFFPLDVGFYQPSFGLVTSSSTGIGSIATSVNGALIGSGLWLLSALVSGALLPRSAQRRLLPIFAATAAVLLVLVLRTPDTDRHAMTRYLHPYLSVVWIGAALYAAPFVGRTRMPTAATIAVMVGIGAVLIRAWSPSIEQRSYYLFEALRHAGGDESRARMVIDTEGPRVTEASDRPPHEVDYAGVQAAVPPGDTILAMVDDPAKLDFGRNRVWLVDLPAAEAPPPGYPDDLDSRTLVSSLKQAGIRWVLIVQAGRSTDAYLASSYHPAKPAAPTIGKMLGRIEQGLLAYQSIPVSARAAGNEDLLLFDLEKLAP